MRLILMSVQILIVWLVFDLLGGDSAAFQLGAKGPQPGLVSTYEVFFIYLLSLVCVVFQSWLIAYERHQNELTTVVGGVLVIIGILMPKLLESYSILRAYCSEGGCASGDVDAIVLFEMGIACAAALAAMFVVGLFSESIRGLFRSSEVEVSAVSKGTSPADSHNAEVPVPASEVAIASDAQNDGVVPPCVFRGNVGSANRFLSFLKCVARRWRRSNSVYGISHGASWCECAGRIFQRFGQCCCVQAANECCGEWRCGGRVLLDRESSL